MLTRTEMAKIAAPIEVFNSISDAERVEEARTNAGRLLLQAKKAQKAAETEEEKEATAYAVRFWTNVNKWRKAEEKAEKKAEALYTSYLTDPTGQGLGAIWPIMSPATAERDGALFQVIPQELKDLSRYQLTFLETDGDAAEFAKIITELTALEYDDSTPARARKVLKFYALERIKAERRAADAIDKRTEKEERTKAQAYDLAAWELCQYVSGADPNGNGLDRESLER